MSSAEYLSLANKVLDVEAQSIIDLKSRLGDSFSKCVDIILKCEGKLVLTGIGKSGAIAKKLASTFSSTGTAAVFLHPAESAHGDLGLISSQDVILALSYGGETPELNSVLSYVARKGLPLIAITGNSQSELANKAIAFLDVKVSREACPLGLAPTASSTATLAMGDALAMVVSAKKGFTSDNFAEVHPGGGLGVKLLKVSNIMHSGSALPILNLDASMKEVLSAMSRGETRGAVGIVDEKKNLAGIITDGDIRRWLDASPEALSGLARDRMSRNPKTIDSSELAEKALFVMEQFRINLLFVLDQKSENPHRPVGLIHVQDLLRAKIR
jgi:arabinose-5-phosphate isomerase